ncbi:hypothetical protein [Algoriphagus sp. PAP.12]|uniref:hypothetical protein n=1 Tax=Algoriphagus sp. PAP.12 TaxID=2996678 RepID=UPI00227B98E7|nr:hypothetical protein [Algoriphagus sp. PAP.12]
MFRYLKSLLFLLLVWPLLFFTCGNEDEYPTFMEGAYSGIFIRNGESSEVELKFENGKFEGNSEITKFPAICNGTYQVSGNKIEFTNSCAWTAEFDWSLILSGSWGLQKTNTQLTLTHSNGDRYILNSN